MNDNGQRIAEEEWDFRGLDRSELHACMIYEYARESKTLMALKAVYDAPENKHARAAKRRAEAGRTRLEQQAKKRAESEDKKRAEVTSRLGEPFDCVHAKSMVTNAKRRKKRAEESKKRAEESAAPLEQQIQRAEMNLAPYLQKIRGVEEQLTPYRQKIQHANKTIEYADKVITTMEAAIAGTMGKMEHGRSDALAVDFVMATMWWITYPHLRVLFEAGNPSKPWRALE